MVNEIKMILKQQTKMIFIYDADDGIQDTFKATYKHGGKSSKRNAKNQMRKQIRNDNQMRWGNGRKYKEIKSERIDMV